MNHANIHNSKYINTSTVKTKMAEPPPIDEDVLGDGDASFLDGRSSGIAAQTESAVLSRLEQQTQEIKSLKTALLEQKELYRSTLGELATEKEKNKALSESLEELKTARGTALPPVEQTARVAPNDNSMMQLSADATVGETTARLNERVRAYELEIRSLRDDVKAWDEAAALNEARIRQLQLELASTADGKESAMSVLQEATQKVKQLEEELARREKGSPKADKAEQSNRSNPAGSKRACSYSMGQVADLAAEADALRMNLDVAQRNLRETERLREIDAGTIEQLRTECDRLAALLAAKMAEQEMARPSAFVGMGEPQHSSQQDTLKHSTIAPFLSGGDTSEDKSVAVVTASLGGGDSTTDAEGRVAPSQECQMAPSQYQTEVQMEETSDPSGAQAAPECEGPSASRQVDEVGKVQLSNANDGHETIGQGDTSILIS